MIVEKIKAIIKICRFNEVLLVLPYAGTASFLIAEEFPDIKKLIILLIAIITGFSAGNIFNAYADRDIDADNPRTKDRPLVKNQLTRKEVFCLLIINVSVMVLCTYILNPVFVILLPIPATICFGYSLCKRFTWCGHFVLGIAHAICPVAGWLVFESYIDYRFILFGAVVFFWTFSLDMIYSSQDEEYDKENGLYSIPVVFGKKIAFVLSIICHVVMVVLYILLAILMNCGNCFFVFFAIDELLLLIQYVLIFVDEGNSKYALNINQIFAIIIFVGVVCDKF